MMFFVFNNDGVLSLSDIRNECQKQKWVPLLVYRKDGKTYVPAFHGENTIKNFVRRNAPKGAMWGAVTLTDKDMETMRSKDWIIEEYSFPRKISGLVEFDLEVIEFNEEPMVITSRR